MNLGISERIADLRKVNQLSQLDLASALNISHQSVSKWERDESLPELTLVVELARLFHVSTDYLLTGKKDDIDLKEIDIEDAFQYLTSQDIKEIVLEAMKNGAHFDLDDAFEYLAPNDMKEITLSALEKGFKCDLDDAFERLVPGDMREIFLYALNKGMTFDLNDALDYLPEDVIRDIIKSKLNR